MVLALTINSADGIATALRIKAEVEGAVKATAGPRLRMAVVGGAESHLVARELTVASVGVTLVPLQRTASAWDARRTPPGAPLANGTAVDWMVAVGVTVGVGLLEDWQVRDLGLAAGTVWRNSNGRLSEAEALDLVSDNIHRILGADVPREAAAGHFIVSDGSRSRSGRESGLWARVGAACRCMSDVTPWPWQMPQWWLERWRARDAGVPRFRSLLEWG